LDANSLEVDDVPQCNKLVSGNRIINYPSLVSALQAIGSCQHCVQDAAESFSLFCDGKFKEKLIEAERKRKKMEYLHESMNVREWYKEWEKQEEESRSRCTLTVQGTTYGLATNITIKCNICKQVLATIEAAKMKQYKRSNSDFCHHDINILFSMALQLMGVGGEHGASKII
jgi:hypothetical protein